MKNMMHGRILTSCGHVDEEEVIAVVFKYKIIHPLE